MWDTSETNLERKVGEGMIKRAFFTRTEIENRIDASFAVEREPASKILKNDFMWHSDYLNL